VRWMCLSCPTCCWFSLNKNRANVPAAHQGVNGYGVAVRQHYMRQEYRCFPSCTGFGYIAPFSRVPCV
jgi:hypothetical protein